MFSLSTNRTALIEALLKRDSSRVKLLLDYNPDDANQSFYLSTRQLPHRSIEIKGQSDTLAYVLESYAGTYKWTMRPIHLAVIMEDEVTLKLLLTHYDVRANLSVEIPRQSGMLLSLLALTYPLCTALHLAVILNYPRIVEILLAAEYELFNKDSKHSMTALDFAFILKRKEIVHILVPLVDVPAESAISLNEIFENFDPSDGQMAIRASLLYPSCFLVDDSRINIIRLALDKLGLKDAMAVIKTVISHGYPVSKLIGFYKESFLHVAVAFGHLELVKLFLDEGVPVNIQNKRKETPLHHLVFYGDESCNQCFEVLRLLLSIGGNVYSETSSGLDVFQAAVVSGKNTIVKRLLSWPICGLEYKKRSSRGESPLQFYVRRGIMDESVLRTFKELGHPFDTDDNDRRGLMHTLLSRQVWQEERLRFRCIVNIGLLLKYGVSLNVIDKSHQTAFMVALCDRLHLDIVRTLAPTTEATANVTNVWGQNAIEIVLEQLTQQSSTTVKDTLIQFLTFVGVKPTLNSLAFALKDYNVELLDQLLSNCHWSEDLKDHFPNALIEVTYCLLGDHGQRLVLPLLDKLVTIYNFDVNRMDNKGALIHHLIFLRKREEKDAKVAIELNKILDWLLNRSDVDLAMRIDSFGNCAPRSPLEMAVYYKDSALVADLLAKGAPVDGDEILAICMDGFPSPATNRVLKVLFVQEHRALVVDYWKRQKKIAEFEKNLLDLEVWLRAQPDPLFEVTRLSGLAADKVRNSRGSEYSKELANSAKWPEHVRDVLVKGLVSPSGMDSSLTTVPTSKIQRMLSKRNKKNSSNESTRL